VRFEISGAVTLVGAGRRSGRVQTVPVIPVEHDGARYLVSPRGEAEWVRNLRAVGGQGTVRPKAGTTRFQATEIPVAERSPILAAYRRVAGQAVAGDFAALPNPQDHPVFRFGSV
jgi:deazaflavin-dependent oxidoreductase (nitroreductase family)